MREHVIAHLRSLFALHRELLDHLPEEALGSELPVPSNTIGSQLWCLLGARQSYTRALLAGAWQGFHCTLSADDVLSREKLAAEMDESVRRFIVATTQLHWDDERDKLLLDLLEHEAQHQGQLIRYVYGLELEFPPGWKARWNL